MQTTRLLCGFMISILSIASALANADPVVKTAAGQIRGAKLEQPSVHVFRGVRYGESTAGSARFKSPRPVASWEGVKDATRFGHTCPQGGDVGRRTTVEGELLPMSEDCLVLNIWTPAVDAKKRPVMVWLHGRGFYAGAGSERLYDGARLARRGNLVVVTVNHRLNVFGYLQLDQVGGAEFATSGNVGMQDIELALKWVGENIDAFGGDPTNVTIFGESGGGVKVSTLLGIPSAKGLFHRGIIQSGARLNGMKLATAQANAKEVMQKLNVTTVAQLQAVPVDKLLAAVMRTPTGRTAPDFGPVVDGKYLPRDMFTPDVVKSAHGVPVIVGSNRDEHALYVRDMPNFGKMTEAELIANLTPDFKGDTQAFISAYRESRPDASPWDLMVAIRSNRFHVGAIRLAEAQSKVAPVYMYSFDFAPAGIGAAHGAEIPFVFNNATADRAAKPQAKAVEDAMSEAWIAFARTGNPNHPTIPKWPTYDAQTRATMIFDEKTRVVNDPRAAERKVWEGRPIVR